MDLSARLIGAVVDGRYRLRELIGRGSYGIVYSADELTLGSVISQVAVKVIPTDGIDQRQTVLKEILGLASLTHDYVIGYRSSGELKDGPVAGALFLATELGDTNLGRLLKSGARLREDELRQLVRGLALALDYIHSESTIHGDVKPANIFRVKGRWKLGDLGLLRMRDHQHNGIAHGSLPYMAPEMLHHQFTPANDAYALGVTLLYYFTGGFAHQGDNREEFTENLRTLPAEVPESVREPWRSLIVGCLHREPAKRLTPRKIAAIVAPESKHFAALAAVQTITVSPFGVGDCKTIQQALDAAAPGARILVHPGKYRESLRIDRPVELRGDGPIHEVVISTRDGHCLEVACAGDVRISGFTMRVKPGGQNIDCYALDVNAGTPVIEDCAIRSLTLPCLAVHGDAQAYLRRCTIHGSRDAGVFIFDGGHGEFERCDINGNGSFGVTLAEGGLGRFAQCDIQQNHGGGVAIFGDGQGFFDGCHITRNGKAGVAIAPDGVGEFQACEITRNAGEGLILKGGATVSVTSSDLRKNKKGPWNIADYAAVNDVDNLT